MKKTAILLLVGASTLGGWGCSAAEPSDIEAVDVAEEQLSDAGASTYYTLTFDARKCVSPLCGGYWVTAVNRFRTTCVDGKRQSECYVAELELSSLGLSEEQISELRGAPREFLLRGKITPHAYDSFGELGVLEVSEAWRGHSDVAPNGLFYRATDNGVRCITSPCLSIDAKLLNSILPSFKVGGVALDAVSKDPSDGYEQLAQSEGVLLAARLSTVTGPAGRALALNATEYYLPFEYQQQACGSRGLPECPAGSYCNIPPQNECGSTDRGGVCEPIPSVCTKEYIPVCGCDGNTYGNACTAAAAGVSVAHRGGCESGNVCGTIAGLLCERGEYCDYGVGQCRVADAAGVCKPIAEVCTTLYAPVCGCDGKTYSNACVAAAASVSVDYEGECRT